ncbi:5'-methylthioadenosine nucleosidase [Polynucleobacter paneuropaeus]|nr:5'-methylthioadenosine nucleosidase [Polynucleobacter paneuropaeus]MBT8569405.1 5'-methylthioadenosine nucleosidase [Polynucleobacter paneuropaeus]QWC97362.1 5'-methylthioadenosine nucleosidase [Polynucleobacter paneuropaeus]QWD04412.1 5'-methylthioadenosine nucleosidase [Polynucleobacter paneuropaeus]
MKKKIVVMVALERELNPEILPTDIPVIYSGVGKVNAAVATFNAIIEFNPDLIIHFGTVGKITASLSGLIPISSVVQRDMNAEPLAPRGVVPFSNKPNQYASNVEGYVCGTGDSFVTQQDDWLEQNGVDVVDMELFAIAAVAFEHNISWLSYGYISDAANESAGQEWSNHVNEGEKLFIEKLQEIL